MAFSVSWLEVIKCRLSWLNILVDRLKKMLHFGSFVYTYTYRSIRTLEQIGKFNEATNRTKNKRKEERKKKKRKNKEGSNDQSAYLATR